MMMQTGIYAITHTASGRCYVGSALDFRKRWRVHRHHLRKAKHHSVYLQRAWDRYGEEAFSFRVLLVCAEKNLSDYEQRCIDGLMSCHRDHGFNMAPVAGSMRGFKHSEESRAKNRAAQIGKRLSPEHLAALVAANTGRKPSAESRERMRQARLALGYKHSEETLAKMRKHRAKKISPETRAKWSAARKGRKMPEWFPEFASKIHSGKTLSAETREKIGAAQRGKRQPLSTREKKASKLTMELAREIRRRCAEGETQRAVAKALQIDQSHVSNIVRNKCWPDRPE